GLWGEPLAVVGFRYVDEAARLAAVRGEARQGGLDERAEQAVELEADHGGAGRLRGEERVVAEAERRVEHRLATVQAGGGDERIGLAAPRPQQPQIRHPGSRSERSALLVEIGAACGEDEDRRSGGVIEEGGERSPCPVLGAQAESASEVARLGRLAPRGGRARALARPDAPSLARHPEAVRAPPPFALLRRGPR